jgi:hypothetical protein
MEVKEDKENVETEPDVKTPERKLRPSGSARRAIAQNPYPLRRRFNSSR